jgi:hypothetical protein
MHKKLIAGLLTASLAGPLLASPLHDQVSAMSDSGKRGLIGMLVRQSGQACPAVRRTFFQGRVDKQHPVWNVACNSRDEYALVFYEDAANSTRVLKCAQLKATLGTPKCFTKL